MKKRLKKKFKKRGGLFIGHPGSFAYPFWELEQQQIKEKLACQLYRKGNIQRKLKARIRKLNYLMWDYKNRHRPYKEPKQIYKHQRAKRNPIIQLYGVKFRKGG